MPAKMPWVDRRFSFEYPVSMFPNLLERLRGTPARVEERVTGLTAPEATRRPGDGWSVQEQVGHLIDVEALWLGRLDDYAAGLEELRPADMSNRRTYEADHNARELAEVLAGFRRVREEFVARLQEFDEAALGRPARHPRLDQPMRIIDLMVFAAEHDDHHLATIGELLARPDAD